MTPTLATAAVTDPGRVRARNEDAFVLAPELGLVVVADGMGGHPAGDVASGLAAEHLRRQLSDHGTLPTSLPSRPGSPSPLGARMVEAVRMADARVRGDAAEDTGREGMGTTLTALVVRADEGRATIGHVGDSRAYAYTGGRLRQLTVDHTWVQEQVDAGGLTPSQAREHPWSHVLTQSVGVGEALRPQLLEREATPGDVYLLCTDGLTTMLTDVAMERILEDALPAGLDAAARALVDAANERGGLDNVTVVLVRVEE